MRSVIMSSIKVPIVAEAEVVVVGGGPAGFGAAVRAARDGAKTVIIERFGSPGGMVTNGFMCVVVGKLMGGLHTELLEQLRDAGYTSHLLERSPELASNPLFHYNGPNIVPGRPNLTKLEVFDPNMAAITMNAIMQECGVDFFLRSLFVDAHVEDDALRAVIVENASGKQAIGGKVFIDATGRGDLVARAGAPFLSAGNEIGLPIPPGLMWKMSGVDFKRLVAYQKEDPALDKAHEIASANGELPHYRPKKEGLYGGAYSGHPRLEMCPMLYRGDILLWAPAIYEWGLDCAEKADDLTRAELELRKHIVAEAQFLMKYVPGFEKAHISGIAPFMGIREGRHPQGEYRMRYADISKQAKFDDAALTRTVFDWVDTGRADRLLTFDIPYRCFLAKGLNNLLLAGDNISMEHEALLHIRGFGMAVRSGEVAGTAAALALKNGQTPLELKWKQPL